MGKKSDAALAKTSSSAGGIATSRPKKTTPLKGAPKPKNKSVAGKVPNRGGY